MLETSALHGIVPPIVTPLTPDGEVDHRSLASAGRFLLASGVHGIWAAGTTGEFPCFTAGERAEIVQTCVEAAGGRVPVVANVGDCSTKLAVDHARRAAAAGADALALTPPYYYLNSQGELMDHFPRRADGGGPAAACLQHPANRQDPAGGSDGALPR